MTLVPTALLSASRIGYALAADLGNAKEARAMLDKAIARSRRTGAAGKVHKGRRDSSRILSFCASMDGTTTAHPHTSARTSRAEDKTARISAKKCSVAERARSRR